MSDATQTKDVSRSLGQRLANLLAALFTAVIVLYAASGPLNDLVRWLIEVTTPGFDELGRRDQRLLFREYWLGASYRSLERSFLLPTGLVLGLPITFAFAITYLTLFKQQRYQRLNWILAILSTGTFAAWIVKLASVDAGLLPSANPIDFVLLPLAIVLTLYLTYRFFGSFIVGFCLFWIIYFFFRGYLPEWTGIFAGSSSTLAQGLRTMVLSFWAQTGGMFG